MIVGFIFFSSVSCNLLYNYVLVDSNRLNSYLIFLFKRKYSITYEGLDNVSDYPVEIYDGENLELDMSISAPESVQVYMNDTLISDYTFTNNILTINSVNGNIRIVFVNNDLIYDVPVTEDNTNIVEPTNGENIVLSDLLNKEFSGINGTNKIINKIEVVVVYTSRTCSNKVLMYY